MDDQTLHVGISLFFAAGRKADGLYGLFRTENNLASLSCSEGVQGFVDLLEPYLLGDQGTQIHDFVLQKPSGSIPGVEDPAAVQCQDSQILEDHALRDINGHGLRWDAE